MLRAQFKSGFKAGVQDYRLTYYILHLDYTPKDTESTYLLLQEEPQVGVPPGEAGAGVAATISVEFSTGT